MIGLPPELLARIQRIAKATGRTPEQVLYDAVQAWWVKFATSQRLEPGQW